MENRNEVQTPLEAARALYDDHEYVEAVNAYQKILDSGETAEAYQGLADSLSCLWRYDEAIVAYNKSIKLDPTQPDTYSGLGEALYDLRRFREAITNYQTAADIYGNQAEQARTEYKNLIAANDPAAEDKKDEAQRANEKVSDRCNDLGFAYLCIREYDEAIAQLHRAIDKGQQYPYAHHSLASIFWTQGNYKDAMSEWKKPLRAHSRQARD